MTEPSPNNSLADGLGTLGRSKRVRAALIAGWPYILPVVTLVAGWLAGLATLGPRLAVAETALETVSKDVAEIKLSMLVLTSGEQQKILTVGRQAAYATAGFEAFEPAKLQKQKREYAEKYAAAYERMVLAGETPAHALVALFTKVDVP